MEYSYKNNNNKKLIVFFLGWSCDQNTLRGFDVEDFDILSVFDYRDMNSDFLNITKSYDKVIVLAWSFGVWAAEQSFSEISNLCGSIAINGTPLPINDQYGIVPKIYDFTLKNIKRRGIDDFNKRMCGDNIVDFCPSQRSFEQQYEELEVLKINALNSSLSDFVWDWAIVGELDLIFPPQNMFNYWIKNSKFAAIKLPLPHFPFSEFGIKELKKLIQNVALQ